MVKSRKILTWNGTKIVLGCCKWSISDLGSGYTGIDIYLEINHLHPYIGHSMHFIICMSYLNKSRSASIFINSTAIFRECVLATSHARHRRLNTRE